MSLYFWPILTISLFSCIIYPIPWHWDPSSFYLLPWDLLEFSIWAINSCSDNQWLRLPLVSYFPPPPELPKHEVPVLPEEPSNSEATEIVDSTSESWIGDSWVCQVTLWPTDPGVSLHAASLLFSCFGQLHWAVYGESQIERCLSHHYLAFWFLPSKWGFLKSHDSSQALVKGIGAVYSS